MQIFATDKCPIKSAKYLDNKRVVKMVLESAQLLNNAVFKHTGNKIYRITHAKHPCSIWTAETKQNFIWLLRHFFALLQEYKVRYKKQHKCRELLAFFINNIENIPEGALQEFVNCTTLKEIENTTEAYKLYLQQKWKEDKRKPEWR